MGVLVRGVRLIAADSTFGHQYVHAVDIAPTLLELVGISAPASIDGVDQSEFDGGIPRSASGETSEDETPPLAGGGPAPSSSVDVEAAADPATDQPPPGPLQSFCDLLRRGGRGDSDHRSHPSLRLEALSQNEPLRVLAGGFAGNATRTR